MLFQTMWNREKILMKSIFFFFFFFSKMCIRYLMLKFLSNNILFCSTNALDIIYSNVCCLVKSKIPLKTSSSLATDSWQITLPL